LNECSKIPLVLPVLCNVLSVRSVAAAETPLTIDASIGSLKPPCGGYGGMAIMR